MGIRFRTEADIPADVPQILVGFSPRAKAAVGNLDIASLGTEGIVIKTVGQQLILAGGEPRGTIYAVESFLEDQSGRAMVDIAR